jgi:hypothetical protein
MKRWLLRLGLAAVTFTLGWGVYFFTRTVVIYNERGLEAVPYCQVARNAEMYHNSEILVNARIFVDETGVYVYEDCDPVEALAAGVVIDENSPGIGPGYVDNLLLSDGHPNMKTAQALIKGHFDAHASTGCWAPKFQIQAEKIELLSSLTDYVPPQTEGPALRLKH